MQVLAIFMFCALFGFLVAKPLPKKDTDIVESVIREVRAAPSGIQDIVNEDTEKAFVRTYSDSDGGDNGQGYHKRYDDEGAKGYKHFDSFHKKDGDKYGFEHHTAYGKTDQGKSDVGGRAGKYEEDDEGSDGEKENYEEAEAEGDDEDEQETKHSYKVVEDVDENEGGGDYEDHSGYSEELNEEAEEEGDDGSSAPYVETGEYDASYDLGRSSDHYTDGSSGLGESESDGGESQSEDFSADYYK